MSPRAAWRLESLGFTDVYDYVAGKKDWMSAGLPIEGTEAHPRVGDLAQSDAPTCRLHEDSEGVFRRMREEDVPLCVVLNDEDIVLGRVTSKMSGDGPIEDVMEPGPTTVRPDERIEELVARMQKQKVARIVVTSSEGRFLGVFRRADGERVLHEAHRHH